MSNSSKGNSVFLGDLKSSVCFSLKALLLTCFGFSGVSIDVFISWTIVVALEIFDSSFLLAMNRDIFS